MLSPFDSSQNIFYLDKVSLEESYEDMVSVRKRKRSSKVEIYVKDNGTCVPKELVISFSTIFYHKTDGQETGLDLSLSYDIVKPHGGEIKVQSKEGEGSDFTIQLPRLILEEIGDEEYKTED